MSDLRKAAEMAVKALSIKTVMTPDGTYYTVNEKRAVEAIEALRQALAQSEWVGLTDQEVRQVYIDTEQMVFDSNTGNGSVGLDFPICIYRAIEAKLKEKNT